MFNKFFPGKFSGGDEVAAKVQTAGKLRQHLSRKTAEEDLRRCGDGTFAACTMKQFRREVPDFVAEALEHEEKMLDAIMEEHFKGKK